jgi:Fe-S cluster assembly iron-binding protein IscA
MMTLTEAAGGFLSKVLEEASAPPDTAVRLKVETNGLASTLDQPRPGDTTFNHDGRKVLLLDPAASQVLAGKKLDLQPTDDGPRLGIS